MKTLCKKCDICRTYNYKRISRYDNLVQFKYCNGNYELIKQHVYTISVTNNRIDIQIGSRGEHQGRLITRYMKQNPKNDMKFIDNDRTNLKLNNLQEKPRSCNIQEISDKRHTTRRFIGVQQTKEGRYQAIINLNGKHVYLGTYDKDVDAYHHYLLKCEEIGRKINKNTESYRIYEKEFNLDEFQIYNLAKKNKYKNISYDKTTKLYRLSITRKGKKIINKSFKNIEDAIRKRDEVLKK